MKEERKGDVGEDEGEGKEGGLWMKEWGEPEGEKGEGMEEKLSKKKGGGERGR